MADILNLSFGCGNTLLAYQLNQIVDAINRIYNIQSESNEDYIPISGSDDISGNLIPDGSDNYNLGTKNNYWKDIYTSTEHTKILKFHSQQLTYESLGELYVGKDTSNNNETILHFKHGNDNEEIVATRDWVNSLLNPTRINIGSTGSISEELYNDESNYIKIESSSDNPIVIAGYDENTLPIGIKFGDASTGDVLTVYNGKIYVNGDIFGGENGATELNDLSDVDASAARTGLFLMYNGTGWVNSPLPESLIIHPDDVSLNEEYYLMYEKTIEHPSGRYSWVERPSGATELNELDDVEIDYNALELGQVLVYSQVTDKEDNTYNSWVNKTVSGVLTYNQSDHDKYLKVNEQGTGTEWVDGTTAGVSSINNITGAVTITGSGVSTNNNTITITGGGGGIVGATIGQTNLSINNNKVIIPIADNNGSYGVIKMGYTNNDKNYKVLVDYDGNAYVNVPWTASGLTSNSWAEYFDGKTKGITPTSGYYLKWDSNGNLTQDSGSYTLTEATSNALGGIKIGYDESNSGTTKNYAVKLDTTSKKAYVNVPWTDSGARTYTSVNGGPTSDQNLTFGGTFKVPYVSLNTNGQISILNRTMTLPSGGNSSGVNSITGTTGDINFTITGDNYNNKLIKGEINEGVVEKSNLNSNVGLEYLNKTSLTNLINALNNIENILIAKKSIDDNFVFWCAIKETTSIANGYFFYKGIISPTGSSGSAKNIIFYKDSNGLLICATLYSTNYFACSYDVDGGPRTNDMITDWKINDSTDTKNGLLTTINNKINGGNGTYTWNSSNWIKTINASDISELNVTKYI